MRKVLWVMMCIVLLSLPVSVMASTSAEKQTAIDSGLAYVTSTQNADGSWTNGYSGANYASAYTGVTTGNGGTS
jgi:hypothetical protein